MRPDGPANPSPKSTTAHSRACDWSLTKVHTPKGGLASLKSTVREGYARTILTKVHTTPRGGEMPSNRIRARHLTVTA